MNRIVQANLIMSLILSVIGIHDVQHGLIGFGVVELWIGGACFVTALHAATPTPKTKG